MQLFTGSFVRASVALAVGFALVLTPPSRAAERNHRVRLYAGAVVPVKLESGLSSDRSRAGDHFIARLDDRDGDSGLPAGTEFQGVVTEARRKRGKKPGALDIAFKRIILPGGHAYRIVGSPTGLDEKYVARGPNGRLIAKKAHRTDRLTYVGYGAGAGLLLGLVSGRSLNLKDTAIGAALGYLGGSLEKHGPNGDVRDVNLKAGTRLGVRIDRSVNVFASR